MEYYKPQLQLYAYAFKNISHMEVKRASILLLETGELEDVDIDYHILDKNYNEIRDFIDFVQNNNNIKDYEKKL